MATASVLDTELNELECPVCHEQFTSPKLLPCGHLLCRHCLIQWLGSSPQADCPLCRCTVVKPEERNRGKSYEEMADAFPIDLVMAIQTESQQLLSSQHTCTACMLESSELSLCIDCDDLFCARCASGHTRSSMARHHKVQQLSTLTAKELADTRPIFCSKHQDKKATVFCTTHQVKACMECAFFEHNKCSAVVKIETELEKKHGVLRALEARLNAGKAEQEQAISRLEQHLDDNRKTIVAAAAEVQTVCDHLESAVTSCRKRLTELMTDAGLRIEDSIKAAKTCIENRRGKLTLHKHVVERAAVSENFDAVSGMTTSMETCVNGLDLSAVLPTDAKRVSSVSLAIDPKSVSGIVQALENLGQVAITEAEGIVSVKPPVPSFHDRHGECIILSADKLTAERTSHIGNGIVLSHSPMKTCRLYEVRIDMAVSEWQFNRVWLGVVTQSPDTIQLPDWSGHLRRGVVIHHDWVMIDGAEVKNFIGRKLREVREGGRVGLALDGSRNLHLYINGIAQSEAVATGVAHPCYFMVDVHACWKKVTALPVKAVPKSE